MLKNTFKTLELRNYRMWFICMLTSSIGTNLQRSAQDWIVIAVLTNHSAGSLGITLTLQFAPQLLLVPISGIVTDKFNIRKVLMLTQLGQAVLAGLLSYVIFSGTVTLLHVQILAFALGMVSAIDSTARQTFVSVLVPRKYVMNAVSLNSASFNLGVLVGPAAAGLLIAWFGAGWAFAINSATFMFVLLTLFLIKENTLCEVEKAKKTKVRLSDGAKFILGRKDIVSALIILLAASSFGFNFSIFISKMTLSVYHYGPDVYGLLASLVGMGGIIGTLIMAGRKKPILKFVFIAGTLFGVFLIFSGIMPDVYLFAVVLPLIGICSQSLFSTINSYVQITTPPEIRGRVMAIYMTVFFVGTPLGSPFVGMLADKIGIQYAVIISGALIIIPTVIVFLWLKQKLELEMVVSLPKTSDQKPVASLKTIVASLTHFSFIDAVQKDGIGKISDDDDESDDIAE
jgi:MFS family permease